MTSLDLFAVQNKNATKMHILFIFLLALIVKSNNSTSETLSTNQSTISSNFTLTAIENQTTSLSNFSSSSTPQSTTTNAPTVLGGGIPPFGGGNSGLVFAPAVVTSSSSPTPSPTPASSSIDVETANANVYVDGQTIILKEHRPCTPLQPCGNLTINGLNVEESWNENECLFEAETIEINGTLVMNIDPEEMQVGQILCFSESDQEPILGTLALQGVGLCLSDLYVQKENTGYRTVFDINTCSTTTTSSALRTKVY